MRTLVEIPLWILANVICSAIPTAIIYKIGTIALGWNHFQTGFYVSAMLVVTMTWGSWAALIWSRSSAVRIGLRASTMLPGMVTFGLGALGLWTGFGPTYAWALIMASGLGTSVAAVALHRSLGVRPTRLSQTNILTGLFGFPLITTAASGFIGGAWYSFVTSPADGNWRALVSFGAVMITVLAMALISTVIPAITSSVTQRATSRLP